VTYKPNLFTGSNYILKSRFFMWTPLYSMSL